MKEPRLKHGYWLSLLMLGLLLATQAECATMKELEETLEILSRQLMTQQLAAEERVRSEGQSGLKLVRQRSDGTKNYYAATHNSKSATASIHDHANNERTVGMGEFIGVLNGVEFRTRHNDYSLQQPDTTSGKYHKTKPIPFPDVPSEVKGTLDEQITEMRAWFKAWRDQDHSERDYRKHFKSVLCYLEGAWTTSTGKLEESFKSDRHFIDSKSWFDLQDKIRFTSYTGDKSLNENFAYLPTKIMTLVDGKPVRAQWNYRIMCHPTKDLLPVNRLRVVDDLAARMKKRMTLDEIAKTRSARFQINPMDKDTFRDGPNVDGLLDDLMSEVPGKDNYQGKIYDSFEDISKYGSGAELLNIAFYHRWFRAGKKDAGGVQGRHRGFNDPNLFVAMNTQDKVAGVSMERCKGRGDEKVCETVTRKASYAIPLEIIYLTPLSKWNPVDIEMKGDSKSTEGKTVSADGRNGGRTEEKAFDGANSRLYYLTPDAFYTRRELQSDTADTSRKVVGVLNRDGDLHLMRASGVRVFFPEIPGLGYIRQRYPIFPVHGEGSSVWKELEALKDIVLEPKKSARMFRENVTFLYKQKVSAEEEGSSMAWEHHYNDYIVQLETGESSRGTFRHTHLIILSPYEAEDLYAGHTVFVTTEESDGHTHNLELYYDHEEDQYSYITCDNRRDYQECRDRHPTELTEIRNLDDEHMHWDMMFMEEAL